jgi:hypothetical protein
MDSHDRHAGERCRAIPIIPGGEPCPRLANSDVVFGDECVPVCRRHASMYIRWGAYAQTHAEEEWGWVADSNVQI